VSLWVALGLNVAMFLIQIVASLVAESVTLRADALDFHGDTANYGFALAVVGLPCTGVPRPVRNAAQSARSSVRARVGRP
jgi:Co/Zn/Cd efflux system component